MPYDTFSVMGWPARKTHLSWQTRLLLEYSGCHLASLTIVYNAFCGRNLLPMIQMNRSYVQVYDASPDVQNKVREAKAVLKEALKSPAALKANVAAMTALANILFQQKQFSEAHRYYCQVTS